MPKDPVNVAVGKQTRAPCREAGRTRKELAERQGMSDDKLLTIEVRRSRLYLGNLLEFARVLGVPLSDHLEDVAPAPPLYFRTGYAVVRCD